MGITDYGSFGLFLSLGIVCGVALGGVIQELEVEHCFESYFTSCASPSSYCINIVHSVYSIVGILVMCALIFVPWKIFQKTHVKDKH